MTLSLILALIWLVLAQATGLLRPADQRRLAAVALTIIGIPLLGWTTADTGPYIGLALLAAGTLSLRLPLLGVLRAARGRAAWQEPAE